MVIGLLKRVIGGVVGAFSGGGNKSQTTETKPPQNASTNQKPQGTQTAHSNQGTKNTGKSDPNAVEVSINANGDVSGKSQDAQKAAQVAVATKKALDANPPTNQGGFSGQTSQSAKGAVISVMT